MSLVEGWFFLQQDNDIMAWMFLAILSGFSVLVFTSGIQGRYGWPGERAGKVISLAAGAAPLVYRVSVGGDAFILFVWLVGAFILLWASGRVPGNATGSTPRDAALTRSRRTEADSTGSSSREGHRGSLGSVGGHQARLKARRASRRALRAKRAARKKAQAARAKAQALEGEQVIDEHGNIAVMRQGRTAVDRKLSFPMNARDEKRAKLFRSYIRLRDAFRKVKALNRAHAPDAELAPAREELKRRYDHAVDNLVEGGYITALKVLANGRTRSPNKWPEIFGWEELTELETISSETGEIELSPYFFRRVTPRPIEDFGDVRTVTDAIEVSLVKHGAINLGRIAALLNVDMSEIEAVLGDSIYFDPAKGVHVTAEDYLSGDLALKLRRARNAGALNPKLKRNVRALESALEGIEKVPDYGVRDMGGATMSSPDVPLPFFRGFLREFFGLRGQVTDLNNRLNLSLPSQGGDPAKRDVRGIFSVKGARVHSLLRDMVAGRPTQVTDTDGKTMDIQATIDAQRMRRRIQGQFDEWIFGDESRSAEMCRIYNERRNTFRPRIWDGAFFSRDRRFGQRINQDFRDTRVPFKPHVDQLNVMWRMMNQNTLVAHPTGSGKRFSVVMAVMRLKEQGHAQVPIVTAAPALVRQWAKEWKELYPDADLLVATTQTYLGDRKKTRFRQRMRAMGDAVKRGETPAYDAVIMSHNAFRNIPVGPHWELRLLDARIAGFQEELALGEHGDKGKDVIARAVAALRERKRAIVERGEGDSRPEPFEKLGVDYLVVDEAHHFKSLQLPDLDRPHFEQGSKRAVDMWKKTRALEENPRRPHLAGRSVHILTPAPVTITDMYVFLRYLAGDQLKAMGYRSLKEWKRDFVEEYWKVETTATGEMHAKLRERNYRNLVQLRHYWRSIANLPTKDAVLVDESGTPLFSM